ncbi:hypothetical protein UPYG_G00315570 [Umbra pygmaea]|uniref:Ig-like domain-containing protein n=1 Tax=Umbra pygmaea TaxID=75934 RepID=A0ABD0W455_UMBPY
MVIHSVDQNYKGKSNCNFKINGTTFTITTTLEVKTGTYNTPLITLFRESSNNSEVKMMCRSRNVFYNSAYWTERPSAKDTTMISYRTPMDTFRRSRIFVSTFNGQDFPLHISPVAFEDSGLFTCYLDNKLFASVKLTTIQVSTSGGPPGDQSVVLRCEVSEVTGDPVTLAWLRMEGSRGVLVKQDVLTESHPNRMLNVTLPSLRMDQLHWQCMVFTQGMLRASVPLILQAADGTAGSPETTDHSPQNADTDSERCVIIMTFAVLVVAGILVAALVFYVRRKKAPAEKSLPVSQKNDPVYDNIFDPQPDLESQGGQPGAHINEEVHYTEFVLGEPMLDCKSVTSGSNWENDAVIYSTLNAT